MLRVVDITRNGAADDRVRLDYDYRHRRRIMLTSAMGKDFLLDLPQVPDLRGGDVLVLSSGERVRVEAADEALMEITCADPRHLARIAWHLGNRHLPAEIGEGRIRIRADHVIEHMVEGLGARVRSIAAPFDPEAGAYAEAGGHAHHHGHGE